MKYLIKNKTSKTLVLLIEGHTSYLYPRGREKQKDQMTVSSLPPQLKNLKTLKFIQITKVDRTKEAD
jgi:hypothetical protein